MYLQIFKININFSIIRNLLDHIFYQRYQVALI